MSWRTHQQIRYRRPSIERTSSGNVRLRGAKPVEIDVERSVSSVAFLADGQHVLCGSADGKIRRWRVENGEEVGSPVNAGSLVFGIAVSRDGMYVVDGTYNGLVTAWNSASLEKVTEFTGHSRSVYAIDVSPDGTKIATGSSDQTVRVWSLSTGQRLINPLKHSYTVVAVKFSPDSRLFATATRNCDSVRVYDSANGRLLVDFSIEVRSLYNQSLVWSKDSKRLFALASDGIVHCLDVHLGKTQSKWAIHSNKDSECIALESNGVFIAASDGSSVSFWDVSDRSQIGPIVAHTDTITSMAISANGYLVMGGGNKITIQSLRDILPATQPDDQESRGPESRGPESPVLVPSASAITAELEETVRKLHEKTEKSNNEIGYLRKTVQDLRQDLAISQRPSGQKEDNKAIQSLAKTVQQLRQDKENLIQLLRVHEQKHHCETSYAEGRTVEGALSLLEITDRSSEHVKSNKLLADWHSDFTNRCVSKLEIIGDDELSAKKYDEAVTTYSTILSLGPPEPSNVLHKWASAILIRDTPSEALRFTIKFKVPKFMIYQAVCDVLEQEDRVPEAITCFKEMQSELETDTSHHDERAHWELGFQKRCAVKLEKLGDAAMESRDYDKAAERYMSVLSLDGVDQTDVLVKWSHAQAMMNC